MNSEIYQNSSYKELAIKNCYNTVEYLLKENLDFAIVTYTNVIDYNPEIPSDVAEFEESAIFLIAGYSKQSATVTDGYLSFEAAFGESNFGSVLSIPLEAIMQVALDDDLLLVNYYEPKVKEVSNQDISLQSLLNNPENQKLIKKRVAKK